MAAEDLLERDGASGHHAVDAPVDQLAPGRRALAVVAQPGVPRVAVAVRPGDVLRVGDAQRLAAELVRDRELEGDDAVARRAAAEQVRRAAVDPGRDRHSRHERVEAVDRGLLERDDDDVAPLRPPEQLRERLGVLHVLGRRLRRRAALDLDVDRRARERPHHGLERRDAEVGPGVALRRLALAGGDAPQPVGRLRAIVAVGVVALGEPVRAVEPLDLAQRVRGDRPVAVRGAVERRVVRDDDLPVPGDADVELEHVGARADRALEGVERVRRELVLAALVGDVEDSFLQPGVGLGVGGGREQERQRQRGQEDATHRLVSMAEADRLYAVPLEDFVEERKRLARELRAAGDKDAAATVAKLPKPTPPAWALNLLAREEPDAVGDWLGAAEALRDASARPGKGLREAMAAHREATRSLVALARERAQPGGKPLSEPMLERVRALLQEATVDEDRAEALRAGLVVEGGDAPPPARTKEARAAKAADDDARSERRRAAEARAAEQAAREEAERVAELQRRVEEAEAEVERMRESAAELEEAARAAGERLADAERTLARSESEAAAARDAASEAAATTSAAERDLRQLTRQLRNAG